MNGSTHRERRQASNDPVATSLLDELDRTVTKRDHQAGVVGNAQGTVNKAQEDLRNQQVELHRLELKVARIRKSFEAYMGEVVDDDPPG